MPENKSKNFKVIIKRMTVSNENDDVVRCLVLKDGIKSRIKTKLLS